MIIMGAEHDVLAFQFWIRSFQDPDDVLRRSGILQAEINRHVCRSLNRCRLEMLAVEWSQTWFALSDQARQRGEQFRARRNHRKRVPILASAGLGRKRDFLLAHP